MLDRSKNAKENRREVAGAVFCKCLVEIAFLFTRIVASATYNVPVGIMAIKNTFAIVINVQDLFNDQPLDGISVASAAKAGVAGGFANGLDTGASAVGGVAASTKATAVGAASLARGR